MAVLCPRQAVRYGLRQTIERDADSHKMKLQNNSQSNINLQGNV